MKLTKQFWKNKKIFITGHTGFQGAWLTQLLTYLNADIVGYALKPNTSPSLFNALNLESKVNTHFNDILDFDKLFHAIEQFQPSIIIHLAAQPMVNESYLNPVKTFNTNLMGTVNILECVRKIKSVKLFLNVTSDKCYKNKESHEGYVETDELGGDDPYSNSKACSELITSSYHKSYFRFRNIGCLTCRSGNIIGGGDWGQNRLIPDIIRHLYHHTHLNIRSLNSIRPWQYILDALYGYCLLIQTCYNEPDDFSGSWNFGPVTNDHLRVNDIVHYFNSYFDKDISYKSSTEPFKETTRLILDSNKAQTKLLWKPFFEGKDMLYETINWYKAFYNNESIETTTSKIIKDYIDNL